MRHNIIVSKLGIYLISIVQLINRCICVHGEFGWKSMSYFLCHKMAWQTVSSWWRHQLEIIFRVTGLCAGNSPVTGKFTTLRPVTRSFDGLLDPRLNKRLSKKWQGWWFETPSHPLWRHCNILLGSLYFFIMLVRCIAPTHSWRIFLLSSMILWTCHT